MPFWYSGLRLGVLDGQAEARRERGRDDYGWWGLRPVPIWLQLAIGIGSVASAIALASW